MNQFVWLVITLSIIYHSSNAKRLPCDPGDGINIGDPDDADCDDDVEIAACSAIIEMYPSVNEEIFVPVEIIYDGDDVGVSYSINFVPRGADCISPQLSFDFWAIDNNRDGEYLIVFYESGSSYGRCAEIAGRKDDCQFYPCLLDEPLSDIPMDTPYTVQVLTGFGIDYHECSGQNGSVGASVNANMSIRCAIVVTSEPTTTTPTTQVPTTTEPTCTPHSSSSSSDSDDLLYNALNEENIAIADNHGYNTNTNRHLEIKLSNFTIVNLCLMVVAFLGGVCSVIACSLWLKKESII